jgi:hypothetical protein
MNSAIRWEKAVKEWGWARQGTLAKNLGSQWRGLVEVLDLLDSGLHRNDG